MLTETQVKNAKPASKPFKLADGRGLYLFVTPSGAKSWRLDYRFNLKRKTLALGLHPEVSLKQARDRREDARRQLANGVDPGELRQQTKTTREGLSVHSFETVAREWIVKFTPSWSEAHAERLRVRFEQNVFPWIGTKHVGEVTATDLLAIARRIESRGANDTAHRTVQNCGQVFRYAIATGRAERNPASDLRGALTPVRVKHHASLTDPVAVGNLLRAVDGYSGGFVTRCALKLAPLVFVRPGELRRAEWSEFNLERAEWRIPGPKMKMRDPHIVPLSRQAVAILEEIKPLTGDGRYVFPGERTRERPMSENTILAALRRMGFTKAEMTPHGFRSMASTLLNEQGWNRDAIERQLAHHERNAVRAAYNYAEFLPERRKMMQAWADHLDELKAGGEGVVSLAKASGKALAKGGSVAGGAVGPLS